MESVSSRVTHTDLVCGDTANKPENEAAAEELTVSQNRRLSGYTTATHTHTSFLNLFLVTSSSYFVSPAFVSLCVRVLLHLLTLVCCQVLSFSSQQTFFYHFLLNTNCHTKIWNILIIIIIIIKQSQYLMTSFHTCCWLC